MYITIRVTTGKKIFNNKRCIEIFSFLSVEVEDDMMQDVLKYYETGVDAPLNALLNEMDDECDGVCVYEKIDQWVGEMPPTKSPMWLVSQYRLRFNESLLCSYIW